jgi:flagellar motor component MotA
MMDTHDNVKNVLDAISVFTLIGSFLEMLTPVFGLIGAVIGLMRIAEMVTGKSFHELIRKKDDGNA